MTSIILDKGHYMTVIVWGAFALFLGAHGLVHLMGFFAYWPLLTLAELPYKTTLFGELLDIGVAGTQLYSVLWLAAALGFIATGIAIVLRWSRWQAVLLVTTLLSLVITLLDWTVAFRGTLIDALILVILVTTIQSTRLIRLRGQ